MRYEVTAANTAKAHLEAGERLAFDGDFLRGHKLGTPFPLFRWKEAFFPRLLTGRLFFFSRDAWESETIDLSGNNTHGKFHPISVPAGKAYWVKLPYLVAHSFGSSARFTTARRWHDPVAWLIGATRSVIVHGPAELLFWGEGLTTSENDSIQADLFVAFDASVPFQVSGYDPGKNPAAHLINAMSSTVVMTFVGGGPLLQTTIRKRGKQRFWAIFKLLVNIIVSAVATWLLLGRW
ncbi:hypothetical protein HZ994_02150 [Akkermansiaceae bacterium]|nr:hypothetical protein HZ994_02150 [Akkermansiaceae bacterium]